jgi:hypothetical protein
MLARVEGEAGAPLYVKMITLLLLLLVELEDSGWMQQQVIRQEAAVAPKEVPGVVAVTEAAVGVMDLVEAVQDLQETETRVVSRPRQILF